MSSHVYAMIVLQDMKTERTDHHECTKYCFEIETKFTNRTDRNLYERAWISGKKHLIKKLKLDRCCIKWACNEFITLKTIWKYWKASDSCIYCRKTWQFSQTSSRLYGCERMNHMIGLQFILSSAIFSELHQMSWSLIHDSVFWKIWDSCDCYRQWSGGEFFICNFKRKNKYLLLWKMLNSWEYLYYYKKGVGSSQVDQS